MKHWLYFVAAVFVGLFTAQTVLAATSGDLIKCPDFDAVYWLGSDDKRYVFPNERVYKTWHKDFSKVIEISCEELASFPLGGNVVYQAGARLVKITSMPDVFAIESNGKLRKIKDEKQAINLYGEDWASFVDDLSETVFTDYEVLEPLSEGELPEGMVVTDFKGDLYRIDDDGVAFSMSSEIFGFIYNDIAEPIEDIENKNNLEIKSFVSRIDFELREKFGFEPEEYKFPTGHLRGSNTSKVVILEYCNLEGPFCQRVHKDVKQLVEEYNGDVAWVFRHYPLASIYKDAEFLAESSECIAEYEGDEAFWLFIDFVYSEEFHAQENKQDFNPEDFGVSQQNFDQCMYSDRHMSQISWDLESGNRDRVAGTPHFVILNDAGKSEIILGAMPIDQFRTVINSLLEN